MTLRLRVLPRFPARISGINGITSSREGTGVVIKSDYGSLVRIPAVDNEQTAFFKVWNSDNDSYSIMTFEDVIAAIGDITGVMAVATYDPQGIAADAFDRGNHTGVQAISTVSGLQTALNAKADATALNAKAPKAVYAAKSGNYTAVAADAGATLRFTATAVLTLTAAATLGNGFPLEVIADGGDVTIDPNGAETINGQATLVVPNGSTAFLTCDGSNFFLRVKPMTWESIGVYNPAAVTSVAITNLWAFRFLRATGFITPSVAGSVFYQTSTNNGAGYDAGASDYTTQSVVGFNGSAAAGSNTGNAAFLTLQTTTLFAFETIFANFNAATLMLASSKNLALTAAGASSEVIGSFRNSSTARNALRISMSSNFSGRIHLEGIRG